MSIQQKQQGWCWNFSETTHLNHEKITTQLYIGSISGKPRLGSLISNYPPLNPRDDFCLQKKPTKLGEFKNKTLGDRDEPTKTPALRILTPQKCKKRAILCYFEDPNPNQIQAIQVQTPPLGPRILREGRFWFEFLPISEVWVEIQHPQARVEIFFGTIHY